MSIFYRACIASHIEHCDNADVKCPYVGDYVCNETILQHEIKEVILIDFYVRDL